jgi:hypothetical protein
MWKIKVSLLNFDIVMVHVAEEHVIALARTLKLNIAQMDFYPTYLIFFQNHQRSVQN